MRIIEDLIRSKDVTAAFGIFDGETVEIPIDGIPRCTDDAVQITTAEGLVWIPRSQLEHADAEEGSAFMSAWIAMEKGLI